MMVLKHMARWVPWWGKLTAKLLLARLPLSHGFWKKLGLFDHGPMEKVDAAIATFERHWRGCRTTGWRALELGPGDSLLTLLVAKARGAIATYAVDAGDYAIKDVAFYQQAAKELSHYGEGCPDDFTTLGQMLESLGGVYLTKGTESLKTVPAGSIDFAFSNAVLEHVRKAEFRETCHQLRRIMHPDGYQSHYIDFKDHLAYGLNHLRFSDRLWESRLFHESGFYTNRLRYQEMLRILREAGFDVEIRQRWTWPQSPIRRASLAKAFRQLTDEDLLVNGVMVVLTPR